MDDNVQSIFREAEIVEKKQIQIFIVVFFLNILLTVTFHPQLRMCGYLILQEDSVHLLLRIFRPPDLTCSCYSQHFSQTLSFQKVGLTQVYHI